MNKKKTAAVFRCARLTWILRGFHYSARPLTPISDRNYHALDARLRYQLKKLPFSASAQENYNVESNPLVAHHNGYLYTNLDYHATGYTSLLWSSDL